MSESNPIRTISLLGGRGRNGVAEPVERVDLHLGQVVAIVGPTGSGKTTLINDIELMADGTTPTGRRILFDGEPADPQRTRRSGGRTRWPSSRSTRPSCRTCR